MLINIEDWIKFCDSKIKGIIHIGAHNCEEQPIYNKIGLDKSKVIWIDAIKECVDKCKGEGFDVYNMVVSDVDNEEVLFKITNNGESSSMLELDTHKEMYPYIHVVEERVLKTTRMDTFINEHNIDMTKYNFLNMDIQGAELKALKGFGSNLNYINYIYTEINVDTLYKDCALLPELDKYLYDFGFDRVLTCMTWAKWGDALYIKKRFNTQITYDFNTIVDLNNTINKHYYIPPNEHFRVCVDIGGYCGNFAKQNQDRFDIIHIYEPQTVCNNICKIRLAEYSHITVFDEAVYRDNNSYVNLINYYGNESTINDGSGIAVMSDVININEYDPCSVVGYNIKTVDLETILDRVYNSYISYEMDTYEMDTYEIDYMNVDCETGEYYFLYNKDLSRIKRLSIEVHPQIGKELWDKLMNHISRYFNIITSEGIEYIGCSRQFYCESKNLKN